MAMRTPSGPLQAGKGSGLLGAVREQGADAGDHGEHHQHLRYQGGGAPDSSRAGGGAGEAGGSGGGSPGDQAMHQSLGDLAASGVTGLPAPPALAAPLGMTPEASVELSQLAALTPDAASSSGAEARRGLLVTQVLYTQLTEQQQS